MVFKVIESDITKSGQALSIFGKQLRNVYRDMSSAISTIRTNGLTRENLSQLAPSRILGNTLSQQDVQALRDYNNVLRNGITYTNEFGETVNRSVSANTAFYRCLGNSSSAAQELARNANGATVSEETLTAATNQLTFAQRASAVATKALVKGLNLIGNIAFAMAINAIITKVMELVNKEKELCDSAKESANEIKSQADEMKKLASEYEAIIDSEKSEAEKTEELNEWKQNLVETYGFEKDKLEELNTERERGIELLKEEIDAVNQRERGIWLAENSTQFSTAKEKITNPSSSSNSRLLDGSVNSDIFTKINQNNIRDSIKNKFNSISTIGNSTFFDFKGENLIETYDNLQNLLSALGNAKNLSDDEKRLLSELKKEEKAIKKVLDDYQVIYETGYKYLAQNNFDDFAKDNPLDNVGKENYLSWRKGLLDTAQGDKELSSELETLIENQFPDLTKYFDNLDKAYGMFGIDDIINDANEGMKKAFINALSDEELGYAIQIPNLFDNGLEMAYKRIEAWKKQNPIEVKVEFDKEEFEKQYEELSKSVSSYTSSQKDLNSALEEQKKYGQLSANTIRELSQAGYSEALVTDTVTGAVTLNVQEYEKLNQQKQQKIRLDLLNEKNSLEDKLKDEQTAVSDLRQEYEALAKTDMEANAGRLSEITLELAKRGANIEDIKDLIAQINGDITSLNAPTFDNDNTDPNKDAFDKLYSKWQHDLEMNRVTQEEYINWLDGAYKQHFSDLTKYQDEYNKYEEEVYKARLDREQDLFDKKIENYKKLSDNALDDKIDFNVVDQKALDDLKKFNEEMQKAYGLGNVDLTTRPKINSDTMRKAGYEVDDGGTATVYSSFDFLWQGDEENGKYVAVHYTPILPDGTVLDEKTLSDYLYGTLEGSQDILSADNLGVVLKVDTDLNISDEDVKSLETDKPTQNIQDIIKACDDWDIALHNVQEQWVELDNAANQSTTSYANKFDYARSQINSAITETQNRIDELSLKKGFEDEIEELTSDLEDLYDTLDDINKQEIESQKDYIETLKNEYSDLMDEQIDQQKKLADSINESYENQIDIIDKQIDAINKVSEAEERQKKILDAEKDVKEAMQELDKASIKNRLVYSGDGTWQLKEDKSAVDEAKKNLEDKQQSLAEAKQDEQISKLEEQKELLETQRDNSKDYYDKVVEDLESQKEAREKQYDILVDIYEQLGGEKIQTSLNDSLVAKLTSNGDINKAVQGLTPTEMKQAITSGILTTDSNGNYAIDYSFLDKNEQAVNDNTAELEKLNNQLSGKSDTVDSNTPTYNNKNLDAEGYLIGTDGKRVLHDGKPIHAKNFSDEIAKRKNNEKIGNAVSGIGKFAGYDTMKGFLNAVMTGEYTIPTSTANSMMNSNINSRIGRDITKVPEYVNNVVNNNNAPSFTINNNVQGDMSEKTADYVNNQLKQTLVEYTKYFGQEYGHEFMRRQSR